MFLYYDGFFGKIKTNYRLHNAHALVSKTLMRTIWQLIVKSQIIRKLNHLVDAPILTT